MRASILLVDLGPCVCVCVTCLKVLREPVFFESRSDVSEQVCIHMYVWMCLNKYA
jgi:hypothetical protein